MESAIPQHLETDRTQPMRMRPGWSAPSPAFSARFPASVTAVVMAYYGVQYPDERPAAAAEALDSLRASISEPDGPEHLDVSIVVDSDGYTNEIAALYWLDPAPYQRWIASRESWTDPDRPHDDVGYFQEVAIPGVRDFETIFGGRRMEGVSVASDGIGDVIAEHGYWGSMRDRLPSAQTSPLEPSGQLSYTRDSDLIVVQPHDGMCLIRSGQDWHDTKDDARERWLGEIRPVLQAGMDFLSSEGRSVGCYSNRLMQLTDDDALIERTYGHGWWHSLGDLEQWAKSHPTHLKIFGTFGQFVKHFKSAAGLRLFHEVAVLGADQLDFRYLGCHPRTGLLPG